MLAPQPSVEADDTWMRAALELAWRGLGWTSPNPPVGCVLVRDGAVIGRGWHAQLGGPHAEAAALADAGDAHGATCYTTLEPCTHTGHQPPCCDALRAAGVRRVVYGVDDADPRTAGRARAVLEARGIVVEGGVLAEQCAEQLDSYLFAKRHGRPLVRLKLALSFDGKLACAGGASQWLSGPESLGLAHWLRQSHDAVLVGTGTVVHDDPRLTVRSDVLAAYDVPAGLRPRDPVRVVLDPRFGLLPRLADLRLSQPGNQRGDVPALILVGLAGQVPAAAAESLSKLPLTAQLVEVPPDTDGRLDFAAMWTALHNLGVHSVLVEGGAGVARGILARRAADRLTLVYTPHILGADAQDFSPMLGAATIAAGLHLSAVSSRQLGNDVVVSATLDRSAV